MHKGVFKKITVNDFLRLSLEFMDDAHEAKIYYH